jgi:thiamine biosynthesis lipoprotein
MLDAGVTSGLVDYDGDLMFFGPGPVGADVWPIDVVDPYDPTQAFARLELTPGGFSTSYYYDRAVEIEGKRYGHLIDPRTGWPASGLAGVGVYAAEQAVLNDVLSTALFIMGLEGGLRLAEELHDIEAILVVDADPGDTSDVEMTAGLRRYLKELRPPRRPITPEVD